MKFENNRSKQNNISSYNDQRTLLYMVIDAYVQCLELSYVATFNPDTDMPRQRVNTPGSPACHYKCDVELTTARALADYPELQAAWFAIANGEAVLPAAHEHALVRHLAKPYLANKLEPNAYFRPRKHQGSAASLRRAA